MNKKQSDGLVNLASGLGAMNSKRSHNTWQYDMLNAWTELDAMYQSNWIARQIVDVPAQDMTREWRRIKSEDAEKIESSEKQYRMKSAVQAAIAWARLYGGAGVLMMTNQDLEKPLNVNKIKRGDLKRLLVFDRWDMTADMINYTDILATNYLRPDFYRIRGGSQRIHWTHFALFMGERLPRRQQQLTQGWGDSVLRKCIVDITDTVASKNGIAELMQEANVDTITREGLSDALASDQDDAIRQRYELFSLMKSNINLALLDADESLTRQTLNLSGVAPIIDQFILWISGAARIPVTKLFGTSAKGLNATGEGDLKTYYDDIKSMQTCDIEEPVQTLDDVLVRSALGGMPDNYDYQWNPLAQANELEGAQSELLRAQRDSVNIEAGVVTRSQVMRNLQSNEVYQYDDKQIDELESLEATNMFEEEPDSGTITETESFMEEFTRLTESGLTASDAVARLADSTFSQPARPESSRL